MLKNAYDAIRSYKAEAISSAEHDYWHVFVKSEADIKRILPMDLKEASILIIGCGYLYPEVLLFSNRVKEVVGIDVIDCFWRDGFLKDLARNLKGKHNLKGILVGINKTLRNRLDIKKRYYARLQRHIGQELPHESLRLISYDGFELPYEDNHFDVVMSNAVLEHIMKLDVVIKEMARVTARNGINYHLYHNYYSFSGNHKPYALNRRYPWGHLRGLIETNPKHLNRVKIYELEEIFWSYFSEVEVFPVDKDHCKRGVDDQFEWEEESLLQRYRKELEQKYPAEMLLGRGFLITGKKKW